MSCYDWAVTWSSLSSQCWVLVCWSLSLRTVCWTVTWTPRPLRSPQPITAGWTVWGRSQRNWTPPPLTEGRRHMRRFSLLSSTKVCVNQSVCRYLILSLSVSCYFYDYYFFIRRGVQHRFSHGPHWDQLHGGWWLDDGGREFLHPQSQPIRAGAHLHGAGQ